MLSPFWAVQSLPGSELHPNSRYPVVEATYRITVCAGPEDQTSLHHPVCSSSQDQTGLSPEL